MDVASDIPKRHSLRAIQIILYRLRKLYFGIYVYAYMHVTTTNKSDNIDIIEH